MEEYGSSVNTKFSQCKWRMESRVHERQNRKKKKKESLMKGILIFNSWAKSFLELTVLI